ncbi:Precorrin-6A reductase [Pseudoprimorskyibacter insulae]|uniref:Precorrin-6A reductase n=2 Tax=Pseudoprimorskyibacter insulae TaxID=1695997 RepID=A0A2R8AVV7_9RHOB|nr:Precorrin-6A reductase [Pseudoprimorskyibacter insulae]
MRYDWAMTQTVPNSRVLIVSGSAEARALARALPGSLVWLPQEERVPQVWPFAMPMPAEPVPALAGMRAVIDACHPCDAATQRSVALAARKAGVPYLRLRRPEWRATRADRWVTLQSEAEAAQVVRRGSRVLLATGHERLARFAALKDCYLYVRKNSAVQRPCVLPNGRYLLGNPPFSVPEEEHLLRRLGIDWIILRNAGGPGGWPKLEAARKRKVRVALLQRPAVDGPDVQTVKEALTWLNRI